MILYRLGPIFKKHVLFVLPCRDLPTKKRIRTGATVRAWSLHCMIQKYTKMVETQQWSLPSHAKPRSQNSANHSIFQCLDNQLRPSWHRPQTPANTQNVSYIAYIAWGHHYYSLRKSTSASRPLQQCDQTAAKELVKECCWRQPWPTSAPGQIAGRSRPLEKHRNSDILWRCLLMFGTLTCSSVSNPVPTTQNITTAITRMAWMSKKCKSFSLAIEGSGPYQKNQVGLGNAMECSKFSFAMVGLGPRLLLLLKPPPKIHIFRCESNTAVWPQRAEGLFLAWTNVQLCAWTKDRHLFKEGHFT